MKLNSTTLGIIIVIAFHIVGILIFCKGYLLTRIVVPTHASCPGGQNTNQTCTGYPKQFKRVLWVIVDALRYDFTVYDDTLDPVPLYRNKLPYIRDLLRDGPNNARLYRFYADAPTTTLQRLKALSTGSLPTFIDFSLNFKGHEVSEDSLPHQMAANNKTVTFLGDDTWIGLYPRYFNTVVALPSFNVKDLHTVDRGVMKHVIPELKYSDTDWIIGHFLGVDHCGHTYGPSHPAMAEKLQEINEKLKLIFEQLDNDTIVFVFGDHGMTKSGDHGGESNLETGAALFVYSRRRLFCNKQEKNTISQIDLVPTTALLMGITIPYSNLGAAIADILQPCSNSDKAMMDYLTALASNGQQIHEYLQAYSKVSGEFPIDEYRNLQQLFNHTMMQQRALRHSFMLNGFVNVSTVKSIIGDYYQFMYNVKSMCISVWAKFDDYYINQGLLILLLGCVVNVCILWHAEYPHTLSITTSVYIVLCVIAAFVVMFIYISIQYMEWNLLNVICSSLFTIFTFISLMIIYTVKTQILDVTKQLMAVSAGLLFEPIVTLSNAASSAHLYIDTVISCAVMLLSTLGVLSNSFIIYEGWVVTFFIQTLIVYKVVRDYMCSKTDLGLGHILIHVIVMACVRSSEVFWICREEYECRPTHFTFSFAMIHEELGSFWSLVRLATYIGLVVVVPVWFLWWLKGSQMWNHFSYQFKFLLMMLVPASLCICGFWIMQGFVSIKQLDQIPYWQHVVLPRIVYVLCLLTIVKCIHESCWVKPVNQGTNASSNAGVYHVITTVAAWMILVMLFHDGSALAVIILLFQSFLVIYLYHSNASSCAGSSWSLVVLWHLMIVQLYYATGHQPTITGMKLDAAFVGIRGDMVGHKIILGGFLIGINTLVSQVLLPWMIPLFILWPNAKMNVHKSFSTTTSGIRVVILKLQFCQTVKFFFSALAASVHRRHLMVWGVFAPRFIYELTFLLVIDLVLVLSYLYTMLTLRKHHSTKLL